MVSFDGSWQKCGHQSLYGFAAVIDVETGLIIDHAVLSKFCIDCSITAAALNKDSPEFNAWYEGHKADCDINFDVNSASGNMEAKAATLLWSRSVANTGFRYTTMVSNGDAKSHTAITSLNPYGDVQVTKEECVNHVSKRLETALRNLRKNLQSKGVRISGVDNGKLTDLKIKKLTSYYGRAIRAAAGTSVDQMRNNILASLNHCISTDLEPRHLHCPPTADTWCFYQRGMADHMSHQEIIRRWPHRHMIGTPIDLSYAKHLMPVYRRLTSTDLLEKCLLGITQNRNESLHSCIWKVMPKEKHFNLYRLKHAAQQACNEFNLGASPMRLQIDALGWGSGQFTRVIQRKKDHLRLARGKLRCSVQGLRRRRVRIEARIDANRRASRGEQLYVAGGDDDLPGPSSGRRC